MVRRILWVTLALLFIAQGPVRTMSPVEWSARGGTWVTGNGMVRQADNLPATVKKYVLTPLNTASDQEILAQVRVDSFPSQFSRVGVSLRTDPSSGVGYNFLLLPGGHVGFLADTITWGTTCTYPWTYGTWYWMKLAISGNTLNGRIWADGQTEAQGVSCAQTGWTFFPAGAPALNGGAFGETASFNTAYVGSSYYDGFDVSAPLTPPPPPPGVLTTSQLLRSVQARSGTLGFDLARFIDIMQTTAQNLVCSQHPAPCTNYRSGTFAVVPSSFYGVGTWMRDSTWALAAIDNVKLIATQTSMFAANGDPASGRVATLILNDGTPWFGAGGQGNPVPDDDSNLMFAIAARLGGRTSGQLPFLNNAYAWIHAHADATGRYRATSFGWEDSYYPLGIGGDASITTSSNMQGLYAVALRALKDLGVAVPQNEIDRAKAQYAALTINGRMRAYEGSDVVDVASLMGDALSLFIWNEPILSDAVVQNTIARFAEVYDAGGAFVGYKVLSNADGSFLVPGAFPVENKGAGTLPGYYLNGGSWMLYDSLALYAGIRHNIPAMRDTYVDRLVKRMAAELRAGVGTTPANKSQEFLCTVAGNPDPCGPIGSAEPQRGDFGWNTFIVRLLSDTAPTNAGPNGPFGTLDTPIQNATGVTGSIAVTGWALDDTEVTGVRITRDPVQGEPAGVPVFIGNAVFVTGARPDVAAFYPALPFRDRAGWGYLLLTNMLPNQGNGTFTLHAYADDPSGRSTLLGSRTITCTNATATRPFGAIDTPAQGETVSGTSYVNFGWVLTPQPKSIPMDGSTITVYIDGVAMGHPAYNNLRSDVAALFPGLKNSNGAVGAFTIDTTQLADGLHTIAWVVTDSAGMSEGIGSRYFTVQNGSGSSR